MMIINNMYEFRVSHGTTLVEDGVKMEDDRTDNFNTLLHKLDTIKSKYKKKSNISIYIKLHSKYHIPYVECNSNNIIDEIIKGIEYSGFEYDYTDMKHEQYFIYFK
jgi:hypothetical protein